MAASRIKRFFAHSWIIIKGIFDKFQKDDPLNYSASIAYYTIFSLPAMLIIILKVAGSFFGAEKVSTSLFKQIEGLLGAQSAKDIQAIIENVSKSDAGTIATIVGVATLIFSATTVFVAIQNALNAIWGVRPKPAKGYIKYLVNRLLSFAMVVSLGFLMLVSLVVNTLLVFFNDMLMRVFADVTVYLVQLINLVVSLGVITFIFAIMFKFLPDAKIKWRDVWVGAFVTAVLFVGGRYLIGLYLGNSDVSSAYGAAGSLIILLLWVNYTTLILLIGAEFTQVYSQTMGHKIVPSDHAVAIRIEEVDPAKKNVDLNSEKHTQIKKDDSGVESKKS